MAQTDIPLYSSLWCLHSLFAVWLCTKSFYCCKILIFIWKWNNQLWALYRRAGASQAEPGGFVRADCPLSAFARSVLTPHARQSKARLRGPFWMNSLPGPSADGDVSALCCHTFTLLSAATELWSRTPRQMIRDGRAGFIQNTKDGVSHFVPCHSFSHPLCF